MVNNKRLSCGDGFSETYTCDLAFRLNNSNGFLPPSPPDSPENIHSGHAAFEDTLKSRLKRKATLSSFAPHSNKRLWTKDDELVILKGIVDYRNETGLDYLSDSPAFFEFIKDDIKGKVSKDQLVNKIRKLKTKFRNCLVKKPCFTSSQDSETFDLSMAIWGKDNAGCVDGNADRAKGTSSTRSKVRAFVEHEVVTNGEPFDKSKGDSFDKSPSENVDKNMENEKGVRESEEDGAVLTNNMGKESEEDGAVINGKHENDDGCAKGDSCDDKLPSENVEKRMEKESEEDDTADELGALQDALETTMFQHLGNYAQKQMLKKLKTLRAKERKELSGEWKSLLAQEAQLKSKKYSFSAKLANAAYHNYNS